MFDQGCAAFHPVTVIHVCNAVHVLDSRRVYVPAYDTIVAFGFAVVDQEPFKVHHIAYGLLGILFDPGTHAPVTETQLLPYPSMQVVEPDQEIIQPVTYVHDELARCCCHQTVKHVAMYHEIAPPIQPPMILSVGKFHIANGRNMFEPWTNGFVVIACDVVYLGVSFGCGEQPSQHVAVSLWPIPAALQSPSVNDVPHEIQSFTGVMLEEMA